MPGLAGAVGGELGDLERLGGRMAAILRHRDDDVAEIWCTPAAMLLRSHFAPTRRGLAVDVDGRRRLAFTGHLHERASLRRRLRVDPSDVDDDAVLVLRLLREEGVGVLEVLNGSFALALHDARSGELLLATDRFASRPLFWSAPRPGCVVFATRVNAVLQCAAVSRDLDERSVRELFHYQRVHGTRTLHRDVAMLPPGSTLRLSGGDVSVREWFSFEYAPEQRSDDEWADELAATFRLSIRRAVGDGHRPGLLLSGGLDSRMVVAATDRPVTCLHFNHVRNREYDTARRIAAARDLPFRYLDRPLDHYSRVIEPATAIGSAHYGFAHGHSIGLLPVDDVDVVVHGFVPEILFRGTNLPHLLRELASGPVGLAVDRRYVRRDPAAAVASRLKYSLRSRRPHRFFTTSWAADFDDQMVESAKKLVTEGRARSGDPLDWFIWADVRYHAKYPSFLFAEAIRAYAEERSVVLHNEVLDLHRRMPVAARADSSVWVTAVNRLSPAVGAVPDANTGLSPSARGLAPVARALAGHARYRLGRSVNGSGSWPDFGAELVSNASLRAHVMDVARDPRALDPEIFDVRRIEEALTNHNGQRVADADLLLLAVTFGAWHRALHAPASTV